MLCNGAALRPATCLYQERCLRGARDFPSLLRLLYSRISRTCAHNPHLDDREVLDDRGVILQAFSGLLDQTKPLLLLPLALSGCLERKACIGKLAFFQ